MAKQILEREVVNENENYYKKLLEQTNNKVQQK